jgi:hypothetical protein
MLLSSPAHLPTDYEQFLSVSIDISIRLLGRFMPQISLLKYYQHPNGRNTGVPNPRQCNIGVLSKPIKGSDI